MNGNGVADFPAEDTNGDLVVDVLDCEGPQGPAGPKVRTDPRDCKASKVRRGSQVRKDRQGPRD